MSKNLRLESMKIRTPLRMKRLARIQTLRHDANHFGWILHVAGMKFLKSIHREVAPELTKMRAADAFAESRVARDSNSVTIARLMGMQAI
jgi:hypothetical protein